ncbi:MAG: bleomycin resistance protein [Pseudomonadales bacterium]|nr:bleomycin resistance protein [Pseudomonadales bacterium]
MTAKLLSSAPVLLVKDVVESANYYRDKVGFAYEEFYGDPSAFVILHRDGLCLMLRQVEDEEHVVPNYQVVENLWDVYFWVDDSEAMFADLKNRGAIIDYELCDQPYGNREFGIQDLDGHDIGFGQDKE